MSANLSVFPIHGDKDKLSVTVVRWEKYITVEIQLGRAGQCFMYPEFPEGTTVDQMVELTRETFANINVRDAMLRTPVEVQQ